MRKAEPFLFLDTNILIWGVLQSGNTPKEKAMVEKATSYLDKAEKDGRPMAISIVTVGEFLVCVPQEEREKYIAISFFPATIHHAWKSASHSAIPMKMRKGGI